MSRPHNPAQNAARQALGASISARMQTLGITLDELAFRTRLNGHYLRRLCAGRVAVTEATRARVDRVLGSLTKDKHE